MDAWLKAEVSAGQFSNERAVFARDFRGDGFSLFANERDIDGDRVRVDEIKRHRGLVLVKLPTESLEGRRHATVFERELCAPPTPPRTP